MKNLLAVLTGGLCLLNLLAKVRRGDLMILEDAQIKATFDTDSGALVGLERKEPHWVIERRPELGVSFRLMACPPRTNGIIL